jgi:hypothetical protein
MAFSAVAFLERGDGKAGLSKPNYAISTQTAGE